jgi:tellurite resistance protein
MKCQELARQVEQLEPEASAQDVARVCLLLTNTHPDLDAIEDEARLKAAWKDASLKLQFATDQHAAMTQELEELASSDPEKYSREQVWVLIRAIKVQSQVLQLYVGHPALDV